MITLTHQQMLERFPIEYDIDFDECTIKESFSGVWGCPVEASRVVMRQALTWSAVSGLYKELVKTPRFFRRNAKMADVLEEFYKKHQEMKCKLVKLNPDILYEFDEVSIPLVGDKFYVAVTQQNSLGVGVHELTVDHINLCKFEEHRVEVMVSDPEGTTHRLHIKDENTLEISRTHWYVFKTKQQACDFLKKELQSQITKQQELINSL